MRIIISEEKKDQNCKEKVEKSNQDIILLCMSFRLLSQGTLIEREGTVQLSSLFCEKVKYSFRIKSCWNELARIGRSIVLKKPL